MTRINTNVSSLIAQNNLTNANNALQTSLTRLSTGLRINSGADDPAGLIAAQTLGSEITSMNQSISNAQQGNDIISTADAALAQVSDQLNTIRGLVQAAASKGGISASEISADQQQVDASLQSIQRIGNTTVFGGQNLLNGSLAFQVNDTGGASGPFQSTNDITVNSFNPALHTATAGDDVALNVTHAATQKTTTLTGYSATSGAGLNHLTTASTRATSSIVVNDFTNDGNSLEGLTTGSTAATQASLTITGTHSGAGGGLDKLDGSGTNTIKLTITGDQGTATTASVLVSDVQTDSSALVDAINAISYKTGVAASGSGSGADITLTSTALGTAGNTLAVTSEVDNSGGTNVSAQTTLATAANGSVTNGADGSGQTTTFTVTGGTTSHNRTATFTFSNQSLVNNPSSFVTAINALESQTGVHATYVAPTAGTPSSSILLTSDTVGDDAVASLSIGAGGGNQSADTTLLGNVTTNTAGVTSATQNTTTLNLIGDLGSSVISVNNDDVINDSNALANAINAVTGTTGITASVATGQYSGANVTLNSQNYGSNAIVTINAISATNSSDVSTINSGSTQSSTAGTDAAGTVTTANGTHSFSATGNNISYSDNDLSLTAIADPTLGTGVARFDVTGGALFQIGASVNYQNQVNVNIPGLDLATLGLNSVNDANEALSTLVTGGTNQLSSSDLTNAASIVDQAINQIATLRGQLGALQTDVFQSNITSLQTSVEQVTSAQSDIQDANFASETANLTRAQILVQAGTSVLSIANSRPQAVLSLLPH